MVEACCLLQASSQGSYCSSCSYPKCLLSSSAGFASASSLALSFETSWTSSGFGSDFQRHSFSYQSPSAALCPPHSHLRSLSCLVCSAGVAAYSRLCHLAALRRASLPCKARLHFEAISGICCCRKSSASQAHVSASDCQS